MYIKLKKLNSRDLAQCQKKGYFDEHLGILNSISEGKAFLYNNTYLIYHDPSRKKIDINFFGLNGNPGRLKCIMYLIKKFKPINILTASPKKLKSAIGNYRCMYTIIERDYHIDLKNFDEKLSGEKYKSIRSRVNTANDQGFELKISKKITAAHLQLIGIHITKRDYNEYEYPIFLSIPKFIEKSPTALLFNVFWNDMLVGFDVVDFLDNTLTTPYGFYLDNKSLPDFLMYKEIIYAKENKLDWFDVGWGCNSGVEKFKEIWNAFPRFKIYLQEYT